MKHIWKRTGEDSHGIEIERCHCGAERISDIHNGGHLFNRGGAVVREWTKLRPECKKRQ
jgi:hypothetical protein